MPILIVEDDPECRESLRDAIRFQGYDTVVAADGVEALAYLRSGAPLPRLILLDLMMPSMNGWQFLQAQRRDERLAPIPVVLVSGEHGLKAAAASLGVSGYLRKPLVLTELLATVERVRAGIGPFV